LDDRSDTFIDPDGYPQTIATQEDLGVVNA
jgi:hypothetical protein